MSDYLVFVDVETTGLRSATDVPLEIGVGIATLDGELLELRSSLAWSYDWETHLGLAPEFVRQMHAESGLASELIATFANKPYEHITNRGFTLPQVDHDLVAWLTGYLGDVEGTFPLCGSTINFDRAFLEKYFPNLFNWFHYRNIDISTLKELAKRLAPDVYESRPGENYDRKHRVSEDIQHSVREYRHYMKNFLRTPARTS